MDLHCPRCNSTALTKVSLAHQEGFQPAQIGLGYDVASELKNDRAEGKVVYIPGWLELPKRNFR